MAGAKNAHKHKRALDVYISTQGNASETARSVGVSRVTIHKWRDAGHPHTVTGGKDWDTYMQIVKDNELATSRSRAVDRDFDFHTVAMETLQETLEQMREKLALGQFEAKPADLPKIIEMFSKLDTRDHDMKLWMNGVTVQMLKIIAECVSPQQYAVIGTKLLDLNRDKTSDLALINDPGLPSVPPQEVPEIVEEPEITEVEIVPDFTVTS